MSIFRNFRRIAASGLLIVYSLTAQTAHAQQTPAARGPVQVATVVTVLGKTGAPPPLIRKEDVNVYEGQVRRDVLYWLPARDERADLQLAIVIDDADTTRIGNQLEQLRNFILAQPKTTTIGLYYISSGAIHTASQLNPDHKAVAKALRLPTGVMGNFLGIYGALRQLMSGWPATGARREILLISEGFDPLNGGLDSPDVDATVSTAQDYGIIVHPLFVNTARRFAPLANSGRDYLYQLASATGGEPLLLGTWTPASFQPYLSQLETALQNQYFLVWNTIPPKIKAGQLRSFKVRLEETNVRVVAADQVFVRPLP